MKTTDRFRFNECGEVFEFDKDSNAYLFIGNLNGQTKEQFIEDYEFQISYQEDRDFEFLLNYN